MNSSTKILVLTCLALAGCATTKTETRTQQVYCVTPDQYKKLVDAMPQKVGGSLTGDARKDFKITAQSDVLLRFYANGLLKVIGGCIGPVPSHA